MPSIRSRGERPAEAAALAAVGGFLDAYTFIADGGVFANAQTGNVVLFGVEAAHGGWSQAVRHVPPVVAFVVGVATVELLARLRSRRGLHRPTRLILVVEMITFSIVAVLPSATPEAVSTVLIAWAATLQVATFRTVGAVTYNTTFTTGNLRSLVAEAAAWFGEHDRRAGRRAAVLSAVIASFAGGAVIGALATYGVHRFAILFVVPVLAIVLAVIVRDTARLKQPDPAVPSG